jgi:glycosyltransferase involved in cell wall biosynthesis
MLKVSVIIPVYNVKPYLERCIKSVQRQTFKDLEIILVNDGSTDGSGDLAEQLAAFDSRIHVIHQENKGISGARNVGLHAASGEYVAFLDADDECDLIIFKRVDIWKQRHREDSVDYDLEAIAKLQDTSAVFEYLVKMQKLQISACFLMVRRHLLIDNDIYFEIGMINEDISWSMHLWQFASTVSFYNLPFYGYYHRPASITTTTSIKNYHSNDKMFSYWKAMYQEDCLNKASILFYMANLWVSLGYLFHTLNVAERPEAINILRRHKDLLSYANSPKVRRTAFLVKYFGISWTTTILGIYWRLRTIIKGNVV